MRLPIHKPLGAGVGVAIVAFLFLALTLPLAFERPTGGRSAERQGYTAGIVRIYCQEPGHSILKGPQIHFGRNPFNLELTVFEWAEGVAARLLGGPACDSSVEQVTKVTSIVWSALGILAVALLAAHLWGNLAGLIAAILLGTDELWMRYATYTMIENRVLTLAVFAIFVSLKRRALPAFALWALTFMQKPQIFVFAAVFWGVTELVIVFGARSPRKLFTSASFRRVVAGFAGACAVAVAWFAWSARLGAESDLPWIIHTGPRIRNWYFGSWHERLSLTYLRHTTLGWLRESGLNVGLVLLLIAPLASKRWPAVREALKRALPMLVALVVYTFVFYPVFIVHEYYALPLNVGRALTTAGVLALILELVSEAHPRKHVSRVLRTTAMVAVALVIARYALVSLGTYSKWALNVNNPDRDYYLPEWDVQVFPKKQSFVVMAYPGSGRDLHYLYMSKQRGFMWCSMNKAFAPRAYWKAQGVEYVAWADSVDHKNRRHNWVVRTIDQELKMARSMGWSSDVQDVWSGKTMAEWARLASTKGKDPCLRAEDYDPRQWEK